VLSSYAEAVETRTFLFTDIEGSTALLRRVGEAVYARVLTAHDTLIRSALAAHGGTELNTMGDGFFAGFSSPRACVAAVLEMQQALEAYAWPGDERVRVRMGVHTGEAAETPSGVVGLDVHRAARIAGVAHGGQVLLSETAAALVRDALPVGVTLENLGLHRLKDLGRPEQIFQLRAAGLESVFPPLQSLGNPALLNNLPVQLTPFIGRARELAEVRALIESARLVTLTGAGGAGKTRLSLQVAAELVEASQDGVWLAELAAVTDEEAVPAVICDALRIVRQPGRPALETLLDAFVCQDIVIVLDNCEHLIGACAKAADAMLRRCPRVHLLATSREPLGIAGEVIYRVPSLSLPSGEFDPSTLQGSDGVALFADRARAQGVDLTIDEKTAQEVVSICRRLDGMPLAIELAAARLRSMSLQELGDRLDQRFRLLTGGSRTALPRQQTLQATVEWSYDLLAGAEQRLLGRLSVFPDTFDLAAAEATCGFGDIAMIDVAGLVGSLVDKNILLAEPAGAGVRYRLLETIRQFAAERLLETGEDAAAAIARRHSEHFLAVAEAAAPHLTGGDQGSWLSQLDNDETNLRHAVQQAAADPDGLERALRFGFALRRYWMARSGHEEARTLLLPVLARPAARSHPQLFGAALETVAAASMPVDLASAIELGEQAAQWARQHDDELLLIGATTNLCAAHFFAGQPEVGLHIGADSVERARRLGDDVVLAGSLLMYLMCSDIVEPDKYAGLFAEAIACTERSGDVFIAALLRNNAGVRCLLHDDIAGARAHLEAAAEAGAAIGERSHHRLVNLGWVRRAEGDTAAARESFVAGLHLSRRNGERSGHAYATLGLACLAADDGNWQVASRLHGAADAFLDLTGEPWQQPESGYRLSSIDQLRSRLGDEQCDRAYSAGKALGVNEALRLALDAGTSRPKDQAARNP
jgi:predicted ATPase/class 3 adenylate cyclase